MIRDYDTMVKALLRCKQGDRCYGCAYVDDDDCYASLASDVLEVLAGHDQIQSHRNTILQTVMGALDKGGYSVTVTPDGEVRMMPWDSTQWISMRDEQPDHDGRYLTFHGLTVTEDWFKGESLDMLVGVCNWYNAKGGWYSNLADQPIKTVTHWMELPTAPEGWG